MYSIILIFWAYEIVKSPTVDHFLSSDCSLFFFSLQILIFPPSPSVFITYTNAHSRAFSVFTLTIQCMCKKQNKFSADGNQKKTYGQLLRYCYAFSMVTYCFSTNKQLWQNCSPNATRRNKLHVQEVKPWEEKQVCDGNLNTEWKHILVCLFFSITV